MARRPSREGRKPRRMWFRRLRRLAMLGGVGAAIGAYRRREMARNEARFPGPTGPGPVKPDDIA